MWFHSVAYLIAFWWSGQQSVLFALQQTAHGKWVSISHNGCMDISFRRAHCVNKVIAKVCNCGRAGRSTLPCGRRGAPSLPFVPPFGFQRGRLPIVARTVSICPVKYQHCCYVREATTIGIGRNICGVCDETTPTLMPEEPKIAPTRRAATAGRSRHLGRACASSASRSWRYSSAN